jgi:hypothetical protein
MVENSQFNNIFTKLVYLEVTNLIQLQGHHDVSFMKRILVAHPHVKRINHFPLIIQSFHRPVHLHHDVIGLTL